MNNLISYRHLRGNAVKIGSVLLLFPRPLKGSKVKSMQKRGKSQFLYKICMLIFLLFVLFLCTPLQGNAIKLGSVLLLFPRPLKGSKAVFKQKRRNYVKDQCFLWLFLISCKLTKFLPFRGRGNNKQWKKFNP